MSANELPQTRNLIKPLELSLTWASSGRKLVKGLAGCLRTAEIDGATTCRIVATDVRVCASSFTGYSV